MEKRSKIRTAAVALFAIGIVFSTLMFLPGDNRSWVVLGAQTVDDPALGTNSGICGFYVFETGSTYTANLTNADAGYVAGDSAINATNLDINHTIGQDLIVWARFNNTDSGLDVQFTRCNMTWTGNITGTTGPDHTVVTATNATLIWVNFVWDNANAGYTVNRGQSGIAIDDIIIKGYK